MKVQIFTIFLILSSGITMADNTKEIPAYIEWNFEIDASKNYSKFIKDAKKVQAEMNQEIPWYSPYRIYISFIQTNLNTEIKYKKIKIIYEYAVEQDSGDWTEHEEVLEISKERNITFGEILYHLHHDTNKQLHNQDIMAIEGFELKEGSENDKIPTYYVFFGS